MTGPILLDGRALAMRRAPALARRARQVTARRGRAPRAALVAFADDDAPRFIARKTQAAEAAGVEVLQEIMPRDAGTDRVVGRIRHLSGQTLDGIFLEFPFPDDVDVDAAIDSLPPALDIDTMTPMRARSFLADGTGQPPITVEAALVLLDAFGVDVEGLGGAIVADPSPFTEMFRAALMRRGARIGPLLSPDDDLASRLRDARLVVASAARPGVIRSADLAAGAVVIDAGYFNPNGRGDVDTSSGVDHLRAIAPVPGAIGPMTVSMLVQRIIEFAERGSPTG